MMAGDLETLDLFEKDCLNDYMTRILSLSKAQMEMRMGKLEENVSKILKLLEDNPEGSQDDWGEVVTTEADLYDGLDLEHDRFADRKAKAYRGQAGREEEDGGGRGAGRRAGSARAARVATARLRSETGRVRERLDGLEDRLQSLDQRTHQQLAGVERQLGRVEAALQSSPARSRSRSRSKHKK